MSNENIQENLKEGEDYVIVTANTWRSFKQWYGGGPDISRRAFLEGLAPNSKRPRVRLYPWKLEIWFSKEKHKILEADKSVGEKASDDVELRLPECLPGARLHDLPSQHLK